MAPNPTIMKAVEQLDYRVTVGDVAAQVGLNIHQAEQDLLVLASEVGGHLQVAESGDIAYLFPKNFRAILRNKFLKLRLQAWWEKIWGVLFYLIRISFGIFLVLSIVLMIVAIAFIVLSLKAGSDNDSDGGGGGSSRSGGGGGIVFLPRFWIGPDLFWWFNPSYSHNNYRRQRQKSRSGREDSEMNFLEAVFSFLFGDGNPNSDLEERRWQTIGTVIRNSGGAVAAEQIAPYLDDLGESYQRESEDYILPVLIRFDGRPEVSPSGDIVYHFPKLQTTAAKQNQQPVPAYLRAKLWQFSLATSNQIMLAIGLGSVNFVLALVLGSLLQGGEIAAQLGGFVVFVELIYPLLLVYGVGFLTIPLLRYFWVQRKKNQIEAQNQARQENAIALNQADQALQNKIAYAEQFAAQNVIREDNLVYSSEKDLLDQDIERKDQIDAEWEQRLELGSTHNLDINN
ncbi:MULTISPECIES: hypothetical protein [unclassified Moorena]|uniref:hypothetical protein n=1 Tax=unclassified Moorena TaxID=2683338 RepID=UPI0013FEA8A4|nr:MULTISPECIES: hypothetical protein [unclassified Moorena]NEO16350.1 hypothetical protein [Moorena sp. SIO3E8]NEQ02899.1 hypothetical protein [Moorena sp. SIO3F7]